MSYSSPSILTDESKWLAKIARLLSMNIGAVQNSTIPTNTVKTGAVLLTNGGIKTFNSNSLSNPPKSIRISILASAAGTISLTTDSGTIDASYTGLNMVWEVSNSEYDLGLTQTISITVSGTGVAMVKYTV